MVISSAFSGHAAVGPFIRLQLIWVVADIVNGLMAIPNLIGLIALSEVIIKETKDYFAELKVKENKNSLVKK